MPAANQVELGLRRNVRKVAVIKALSASSACALPVLQVLWDSCGLSLFRITLLQALFAATVGLLETPTGYIADRIGRKRSIMLGGLSHAVGCVVCIAADNFAMFFFAELFFAAGYSFVSGADQALLYDSLLGCGQENRFAQLWGRLTALFSAAAAALSCFGGWLALSNLRAPFYFEIIVDLLLVQTALILAEPVRKRIAFRPGLTDMLKTAHRYLVTEPSVRWLLLYPGLLLGLSQVSLWFYQPYLQLSGVEIRFYGAIFASFSVMSGLASLSGKWLERKIGLAGSFIAPVFFIILSFELMGTLVTQLGFLFALLMQWSRGYLQAAFPAYLHEQIPSERRATIASLNGMIFRLVYAAALVPAGWLGGMDLLLTLRLFGGVVGVIGITVIAAAWLDYRRFVCA